MNKSRNYSKLGRPTKKKPDPNLDNMWLQVKLIISELIYFESAPELMNEDRVTLGIFEAFESFLKKAEKAAKSDLDALEVLQVARLIERELEGSIEDKIKYDQAKKRIAHILNQDPNCPSTKQFPKFENLKAEIRESRTIFEFSLSIALRKYKIGRSTAFNLKRKLRHSHKLREDIGRLDFTLKFIQRFFGVSNEVALQICEILKEHDRI